MNPNLHPFAFRKGEQTHVTESYVSSPPALTITDERGDLWCLGFGGGHVQGGEFAYAVLRNGKSTGEMANRIERRGGRIRIFTTSGWKRWTGQGFV